MKLQNLYSVASAIVMLLASGELQADIISSTFDSTADGWLISGDSTSANPTFNVSGGNPDGMISAADSVASGVWYFDAPAKFLGDQSVNGGEKEAT